VSYDDPTKLDIAKHAASTGSAGHWPTVAGILLDEVKRLESIKSREATHEITAVTFNDGTTDLTWKDLINGDRCCIYGLRLTKPQYRELALVVPPCVHMYAKLANK
tara:strand:- start:267 stop:584 length:318 start_codon:yes stop_codon:yes gene_type:complete